MQYKIDFIIIDAKDYLGSAAQGNDYDCFHMHYSTRRDKKLVNFNRYT